MEIVALVDQHLGFVADACLALTSEDMLNREQLRACVRTAQRNIHEASQVILNAVVTMPPHASAYLQARVQLAATNLNTAVAAYRAAWSST